MPNRTFAFVLVATVLAVAGCKRVETSRVPEDEPLDDAVETGDAVERAHRRMAAGQVDAAARIVDDALAQTPDDAELWYAKGVIARALGRPPQEALEAWRKAIELDEDLAAAWLAIGGVELEHGQIESAVEHLVAALERDPSLVDAHYNLGLALVARGNLAGGIEALERAHALQPSDLQTIVLIADTLLSAKEAKAAQPWVDKAQMLAPNDPVVQQLRGVWLLETGNAEAALPLLSSYARAHRGEDAAQIAWARALLATQQTQAAADVLAEVASRSRGRADVWLLWGTALGKLGQPQAALERFDRALEIAPSWTTAHVRRLGALAELGRCKDLDAGIGVLRSLKPSEAVLSAAQQAKRSCRPRS